MQKNTVVMIIKKKSISRDTYAPVPLNRYSIGYRWSTRRLFRLWGSFPSHGQESLSCVWSSALTGSLWHSQMRKTKDGCHSVVSNSYLVRGNRMYHLKCKRKAVKVIQGRWIIRPLDEVTETSYFWKAAKVRGSSSIIKDCDYLS